MSRWNAPPIAVLSMVLTLLVLGSVTAAAGQANPVLDVQPNPLAGDTATAFGQNFCGSPGCSPVTITLETRVVASDVSVGADGRFEAAFTVTEPAGLYVVAASQTAADGHSIRAEASLSVPTSENDTPPPTAAPPPTPIPTVSSVPPDTESAPTTTAPGGTGTATGTSAAESTEEPQDGSDDGDLPEYLVLAAVIVALAGGGVWIVLRRKRKGSE